MQKEEIRKLKKKDKLKGENKKKNFNIDKKKEETEQN